MKAFHLLFLFLNVFFMVGDFANNQPGWAFISLIGALCSIFNYSQEP